MMPNARGLATAKMDKFRHDGFSQIHYLRFCLRPMVSIFFCSLLKNYGFKGVISEFAKSPS